jgi:hypothetical protein
MTMPKPAPDTDREARLRQRAAGHGLSLQESRIGNPDTVEHSTFALLDEGGDAVDTGSEGGYLLNLDEVQQYLDGIGTDGSQVER